MENPIEQAINDCIKKGILVEYLKRKGSQVINMLTAEYDYNLDVEVQREEARAEGENFLRSTISRKDVTPDYFFV